MDIGTLLIVLLVAATMISLVVSRGTPHALDLFGAGFVAYRDQSASWPQGVQEEEPVAWSWTEQERPDWPLIGPDEGPPAAEIVDIGGDAVPAARVGRTSMVRGMAMRQR